MKLVERGEKISPTLTKNPSHDGSFAKKRITYFSGEYEEDVFQSNSGLSPEPLK